MYFNCKTNILGYNIYYKFFAYSENKDKRYLLFCGGIRVVSEYIHIDLF